MGISQSIDFNYYEIDISFLTKLNLTIKGNLLMNKQEVLDVIISHTCSILPRLKDHNFSEDDALRDLGANSVDRSEIIMMTLESLNLNIRLMEISMAENIGELASILYEKLQSN